ncbi:sensor domain-containing diguanylate cyclase [Vallitalea okinawensis]|uniref:sensor domain-containing diguanylate cyclase n=1 Tax=Vallitalea okinawensis TaxID=2078660 RepID=UPI000CFB2D52|nr:sensor domain-containing diguanylate cyclase [Vallitalea okinawensis]
MNIKYALENKKLFTKYLLYLFLIFSAIYIFEFLILQSNEVLTERNKIKLNEEHLVNSEKYILAKEFSSIISDLLYISDNYRMHAIDENSQYNVEEDWRSFVDNKKIYDQLRYIDSEGSEVLRINYRDKGSYVVPDKLLQNKVNRDYFQNTINLKSGQVFISKVDLNIEEGTIEMPLKPMIRFSTPLMNRDGEKVGIVVLNYYARFLLDEFKAISERSQGEIALVNKDGFWISNDDSGKEWGFMYEDKQHISFMDEFNEEWSYIKDMEEGSLISDKGLFVFSRTENIKKSQSVTHYDLYLDENNWMIISYIPKNSELGYIFDDNFGKILLKDLMGNWFVFVIILIAAFFLAILMVINRISKDEIKFYSEYDAMTNLLNRRAGLERLHATINDHKHSAICFVDINGLKTVNDVLGHAKGDELIITFSKIMKKCIRQNDYISRLGGDEFLIVLPNTTLEQAESVWERIKQEYELINKEEKRKYILSASHGISYCNCDNDTYIDNLVNMADEKMYEEKREIKKNIKIIRD